MKTTIHLPFHIGLVTFGYLYAMNDAALAQQRDLTWRGEHAGKPFVAVTLAQVTSDGTVNTIVNQNDNIAEITGGETRGSNLFHSFQDFSVTAGNEAFFNNANDIANIFSRVTGGNISNIDGLIRANGNASLFLINPAGILFGSGARLDLGGSFYGSTADSILFDGGEFSATNLDNPPLLKVNAPIGLSFRDNPAEINANDVGLEVLSGANISLIGGNINLTGGLLAAPGGKIELGGLNQSGIIDITEEGNFSFPSDIAKADITLSEGAVVDVTSNIGGLISANANALELTGGSSFRAQVPVDTTGDAVNSGDINIEAESSFTLINSNLRTSINPVNSGDSGDITIKSPQVSLQDNAVISTSNSAGGNIGKIEIIDADNISIDNFSLITASSRLNPNLNFNGTEGSPGGVTLDSKKVSLTNGGIIDVTTANQIDGGNITINADNLEISSGGVLQTATEGTGNAGTVDLNITNGITIDGENTSSQPEEAKRFDTDGDGVIDAVFFDGILNILEGRTGIASNTSNDGNAGEISITSRTFKLTNNAQLLARNIAEGNGGDITLDIDDSVLIDNGASINVEVASGTGNAGNINISANTFELLGGQTLQPIEASRTSILAPNNGQGNAGQIRIEAEESVFISNSIISSSIINETSGNSGNIEIKSPQFSLTDNAIVSVSSQGNGLGGEIKINSEEISVDNFSLLAASSGTNNANNNLDSGNITLNGNQIKLSNGGVINATTSGNAQGGQIIINAEVLEIFSGGVLQTATEGSGNAGDITLNISDQIVLNGNNAPNQPAEFKILGNLGIFGADILNNLEGKTGILAGTVASSSGTGGNININSKFVVAFPGGNSDILANSQQGQGGNININAESVLGIAEGNARVENNSNDIDASSGIEGLDGTVTINTPDINPIQGATELPSNIVSPEQTVTQACRNNSAIAARSNFIINGKGGVSADPSSPLNSENLSIGDEIVSTSSIPQPIETGQGNIQPARGIKVTKFGAITLTAYRTNNSGDRLPDNAQNCA